MLGYDINWAAFNIIEVMSSSRFTYKVCETHNLYMYMYSMYKYTSTYTVHVPYTCSFKFSRPINFVIFVIVDTSQNFHSRNF